MGTTVQEYKLAVTRSFHATPEALFAAWTLAETLGRWFSPTDQHTAIVLHLEGLGQLIK